MASEWYAVQTIWSQLEVIVCTEMMGSDELERVNNIKDATFFFHHNISRVQHDSVGTNYEHNNQSIVSIADQKKASEQALQVSVPRKQMH